MTKDIRWEQRFDNLQRAYLRLRQAVSVNNDLLDNDLIQMALIKAFEMTFELSWKTMKDYLVYNGIDVKLPREVIKQAFANDIVIDGQVWIDMLENRNQIAHTYNEERANETVRQICNIYLPAIEQLHSFFMAKFV